MPAVIAVPLFIEEIRQAALLTAGATHCTLTVGPVDETLRVFADRALLMAAVLNLLQNAFKFTKPHTNVSLDAVALGNRILIEVRDCCGGLGADPNTLLEPFVQRGANRSGLGLGLTIVRRTVEASGGSIQVRDLPGIGCVFTLDLPQPPEPVDTR